MDKAASVFLRSDIHPEDVSHLIRWLRNRNVTRYLNEDASAPQQLEQLLTSGITVAAALVSWWKNNSFTPEAIAADRYLSRLKQER